MQRFISSAVRRIIQKGAAAPAPAPAPSAPERSHLLFNPPASEAPPPQAGYEYRATGYHHPAIHHHEDILAPWKAIAGERGDLHREYLVPRLVCAPSEEDFAFLSRPLQLSKPEIEAGISSLAPWTYHLEPAGVSTEALGAYNQRTVAFHRYRTNLITRAVAGMLGPEAASSTLLDLGCNCGFFTLDAAVHGVGSTSGLDLRAENIAQANFLKSLYGVENANFEVGNVKDALDTDKTFDVVLNLGLMYHLSTPFEVMLDCYNISKKFCVVDTITHTEPFSAYFVRSKDTSSPIEGDLSFELQPTYRGIIDTMRAAGFQDIIELEAPTSSIELYSDGTRRCLVGFKDSSETYVNRLLA
ncbi:class I SAM-dependent methyltransferase [Methylobacterium segetis]|uniref:class I SAM-dependent methyltransferase n=1 Tax=Methylobacterium segetis TaxID=2488750 RepID=UPI001048C59D|nr:class I SAM-dependent methyltransferase [Methylobacterium segetis]